MVIALLALITLNQLLLLIEYEDTQGYQHTQEKQGKQLIYRGSDHLDCFQPKNLPYGSTGVEKIIFK